MDYQIIAGDTCLRSYEHQICYARLYHGNTYISRSVDPESLYIKLGYPTEDVFNNSRYLNYVSKCVSEGILKGDKVYLNYPADEVMAVLCALRSPREAMYHTYLDATLDAIEEAYEWYIRSYPHSKIRLTAPFIIALSTIRFDNHIWYSQEHCTAPWNVMDVKSLFELSQKERLTGIQKSFIEQQGYIHGYSSLWLYRTVAGDSVYNTYSDKYNPEKHKAMSELFQKRYKSPNVRYPYRISDWVSLYLFILQSIYEEYERRVECKA